jgi:uncharacterized membrane-anchored protein YitT (DUF2179 family)
VKSLFEKDRLRRVRDALWNVSLIAVGSILCAVAINGILVPQEFVSSGVTGVALVIGFAVPGVPLGGLYFVLNIPLFVLGWKRVGRRFFSYSLVGMVIFSVAVEFLDVSIPVHDKILSALLAGIITGVGTGVVLRSYGSAGGTDILGVILLRQFSIRIGTTVLAFNSVILAATAVIVSMEAALYTLIFLYVSAHMTNIVITGLSQRKAVFIISPQAQHIAEGIKHGLTRGVTIIPARGGYTGQEQEILYTVTTFRELPGLKQLIREVDPQAFVVVTETLEVMGRRIGNQPHW